MLLSFIVKENMGLKDYLIKYYSSAFFGYLRNVKADVICDGVKINLNDTVNVNSEIKINYTPIKQVGELSDKPIDIIYQDDDCIVINKESGIASIPSRLHQNDTLFNRLLYYFKDQEVTLHFINRLDKDTSGLILVCKNQHAACLFNKVSDTFIKEYQAETYHLLPSKEGIIELPIKRIDGMKRWVKDDGRYGKTQYKLISENNGVFKYQVRLYTGLTHQIRVHFAYLGSPIINDSIYGDKNINGKMHLHACYLKFYHPIKKEWISLNSTSNFN